MTVHPTAVVGPSVRLGPEVDIGPFCVIDGEVTLGEGCRLQSHVRICGPAVIGKRNTFHATASIGGPPQDLKPQAPDARIEIGDDNIFREAVTVNHPKVPHGITRIGSRNRFHFSSHVGHDSDVADDVLLDSAFVLGGHTSIASGARCQPCGGTHQFSTVGRGSLVLSHTKTTEDVPPYLTCDADGRGIIGVHAEALAALPSHRQRAVEEAFQVLYRKGLPRPEALAILEKDPTPEVREIIDALRRAAAGRMGRAKEALR